MKFTLPELCLIIFVGPTGSGKSSFGRKHFKPTEVISSDACRGIVSDDENNQASTKDAFELVNFIAGKRLAAGKLTAIDATNVMAEDRKQYIALAREHNCLPVAIVFNLPEELCAARNAQRPDRNFGGHVIRRQHQAMRRSLRELEREGFRYVHVLNSEDSINEVQIERTKLWSNKRDEHGPFDIIGDIHGCYDELQELMVKLGYNFSSHEDGGDTAEHPSGRKAVFLGDLVDRGPKTPSVLRLVMNMVRAEKALCVPGNHDIKLMKKLKGRDVRITHGLKESLEQLEVESPEFKATVSKFIDGLVGHFVLDDGKLVVAHAGMKQEFQGRTSSRVREFALYGETTGETDEYGLPVRYNWAQDYRGDAMVVYGHTPVAEPEFLNRTVCIDTGCVFGGKLTALRYPERDFVSVQAKHTYYEPAKPFLSEDTALKPKFESDRGGDVLDIDDVTGKRTINTRFQRNITVREENAIAALEVMSRFAVNPKWLLYLPPTMSPCETTSENGMLEHPAEAFKFYLSQGVPKVVCEEKHMGSRAVLVVCKSEQVANKRFGVSNEGQGICYTRTGRRFFNDLQLEQEFIKSIAKNVEHAGLWQDLNTDWIALDCELMPWSAKALELVREQYAAVGAAGSASLSKTVSLLKSARSCGVNVEQLLNKYSARESMIDLYRDAYRRYCWTVNSLDDFKLAPFHILATENKTYFDKNHKWHMDTLAKVATARPGLVIATPYKTIDLTNEANAREGMEWWQQLTGAGGEGMVVKPYDFIAKGDRGLIQPAIKCRGAEYLRIIYGPEYTAEEHLQRLRRRGLSAKRSLALREFMLGVESLERFVRHEPLYRVHECVFAVLALESEPVDPRL
ncbi:MAG TPA: polynucleotide kinase-phosphatase [Oculatellaceae cyanobacterium]